MNSLEYRPILMMDPGSYTAYKKEKNIDLNSYMEFVFKSTPGPYNNEWCSYIGSIPKRQINELYFPKPQELPYSTVALSLDIIGNPEKTMENYKIMKKYFDNVIPVFHYGEDIRYLEEYMEIGAGYIALGGICVEKNKEKISKWVHNIAYKYQRQARFHLLGCTNKKIIQNNKILSSYDSSSWIRMAAFGYPKWIEGKTREKKIERANMNMNIIYSI